MVTLKAQSADNKRNEAKEKAACEAIAREELAEKVAAFSLALRTSN